MKTAILTLSPQGLAVAETLRREMPGSRVFRHDSLPGGRKSERFSRIAAKTEELFHRVGNLIFVCPTGVAVRAIAPLVRHKLSDPAVVVVDVGGRWAVSLLSGHEGGANELAMQAANILDAEPVISTTTEAVRDVIVGIGCRRGASADSIVLAARGGLERAGVDLAEVRLIASVDIKRTEKGLLRAAAILDRPLRFIASAEIRASRREFGESAASRRLGLPGVAEPCALLAGRRTTLLLPKTVIAGATVALARESCLWSASARAERPAARPRRSRPSPEAR